MEKNSKFENWSNKTLTVLLLLSLISITVLSQNRNYIKRQINLKGTCRNVAITKTNGNLIIYNLYGYASAGCSQDLDRVAKELNSNKEYISDIQLTEAGRWLILSGRHEVNYNNIPPALEEKIKEYREADEALTTVSFNDAGDWIIISPHHYASSSNELNTWLQAGHEEFGKLLTAYMSSDAFVAVYQEGYKFYGNVPKSLITTLDKTTIDVYRVKIAGEAWFFSDRSGNCEYYL